MRIVIIMQARTQSTRLPNKALLPVAGYPSAVLAALRAGNGGHEIIVATSTESADDKLAQSLREHSIRTVRGPLDDVLGRYFLAAEGLPDDALVVRLTADNVVPDGALLRELAEAFAGAGADYLAQESPQSGLPYGLGGEAFLVSTLRRAHRTALTPHDREHVSPWIRRNGRTAIHRPAALRGVEYGHLRATIDDEDDYKRIGRLFEGVTDPLREDWLSLTRKLSEMRGEPGFRVPYKVVGGRLLSELSLGTAQLGMEYGIANRTGQPPQSVAVDIVRQAIAHGVTAIDTARAYGNAECVLAGALAGAWRSRVEVITKLDPLADLASDAEESTVRAAVDHSVNQSCAALGVPRLSTLLLHRAQHRRNWKGAAWRRLLELNEEGKIGKLGASVYEPREVLELLQDPAIQHLQIPMNILDWRWRQSGVDNALQQRPDVIVHARSAMLQGLLASSADSWPRFAEADAILYSREIARLSREFGREGSADFCLAYVRSQSWIHSVVVGCETLEQITENLRLFCRPRLSPEQCAEVEESLPRAPEALLNPAQWKLNYEQSLS